MRCLDVLKTYLIQWFLLDLQSGESLRFRCPGDGFGHHFGSFLLPVADFFSFLKVLGKVGIFMDV